MATSANIGLLVPGSFGGEPPSMAEFTEFFRRAEELDFHSLWTIDRIFHEVNILDSLTLLSCAAAVTSRIRLGTSVLLFVLRNPVLMAKTASTLDRLSGGRLILGLSLGGRDHEFGPLGVSVKSRVSKLIEGLKAHYDDLEGIPPDICLPKSRSQEKWARDPWGFLNAYSMNFHGSIDHKLNYSF